MDAWVRPSLKSYSDHWRSVGSGCVPPAVPLPSCVPRSCPPSCHCSWLSPQRVKVRSHFNLCCPSAVQLSTARCQPPLPVVPGTDVHCKWRLLRQLECIIGARTTPREPSEFGVRNITRDQLPGCRRSFSFIFQGYIGQCLERLTADQQVPG